MQPIQKDFATDSPRAALPALAAAAALYARLERDEFDALADEGSWAPVAAAIGAPARPLGFEAYRRFANQVLTPGMPLAAPPVESLHLPWSELPGAQAGNVLGHYRGDHALHVEELCARLGIEVPKAFRAMPDHLALLAELLAFLDEHAPASDARSFARDHFAWLPAYLDALAQRKAQADDAGLDEAFKFFMDLTIAVRETIRNYEKEGEQSEGI